MSSTDLAQTLLSLGWAESSEIVGCTPEEIADFQRSAGIEFPKAYTEFLIRMGKGAGKFEAESTWKFQHLKRIPSTVKRMLSREEDDEDEMSFELPHSAFVFLESNASQIMYFCLDDGDDPPVYLYELPSPHAEKIASSFTEWINRYAAQLKASASCSGSKHQHNETKTTLSDSGIGALLTRILHYHHDSRLRTWSLSKLSKSDQDMYKSALSQVSVVFQDTLTDTIHYEAPSANHALLLLIELQRAAGLLEDPVESPSTGDTFEIQAFRPLFRAYSIEEQYFVPPLQRYEKSDQDWHDRALSIYCFLLKTITESEDGARSFQAHVYQTAAQRYGIPTNLIDWTTDPAIAVWNAVQKANKVTEGTVCFTNFYLHKALRVLLPASILKSSLNKREVFHNSVSISENRIIYNAVSRISFPAKSLDIEACLPPVVTQWGGAEEHMASELVPEAYRLAGTNTGFFDAMKNPASLTAESLLLYREEFAPVIRKFAAQYQFSKGTRDHIENRWAASVESYINELLSFSGRQGSYYIATEQLFEMVPRNRDAFSMYCKRMEELGEEAMGDRKLVIRQLEEILIKEYLKAGYAEQSKPTPTKQRNAVMALSR